MKQKSKFLGLMILIVFFAGHCAQKNNALVLQGLYFGQESPGMTPRIFSPDIVSTGLDELNSVFSPDGREFYFCVRNFLGAVSIFQMKMEEEIWSQPKLLPFASRYGDIDVTMSPDGNKILFSSRRPVPGSEKPRGDYDFWMAEREGNAWGDPIHLGEDINSDSQDYYPMMTNSGAIYFSSQREGPGTNNIYRSELANGKYAKADKLGEAINTEHREFDPYISPDESMLIFTSSHPEGLGSGDLYISFKDKAGNWMKARNMGDKINTPGSEYCSMITPDGKYLFFTSGSRNVRKIPDKPLTYENFQKFHNSSQNRFCDIYWVDAKIIEELRDDFSNSNNPYLGQKPPGTKPELFASGIVTTDDGEGCSGWGNDMEYFVFQRWKDRKPELYIMNQNDGIWTAPELLPFSEKYQAGDYTIAPDGKTLVFASNIFIDEIGSEGEGGNIWIAEKTETGWTEPKHIGLQINTKYHESYPCLTSNGNLYFFSRRPGGYGVSDLYMSEFVDGEYQAPVNLGPKLNTEHHEWDTYTAPDESYMIYCSTKPDSLGEDDLYITFKIDDGSWGDPVHMGNKINTEKSENRPYVSPDGEYFFYTSTIRGNRDIYWVDAGFIEKLK